MKRTFTASMIWLLLCFTSCAHAHYPEPAATDKPAATPVRNANNIFN